MAVSKQITQNFDMERFILKKLDVVEGKERYLVEISNRFTTLENLDNDVDIKRAWANIIENVKTSAQESPGYYELKKRKPWFDEGCSRIKQQLNCSGYRI
jgi:hypothetical protein